MYCNNFSWKFFITRTFFFAESSHSNLSKFRNSKRILNLTSSALVFHPNWQISNFTFKQLRIFSLSFLNIRKKEKKEIGVFIALNTSHTHTRKTYTHHIHNNTFSASSLLICQMILFRLHGIKSQLIQVPLTKRKERILFQSLFYKCFVAFFVVQLKKSNLFLSI